MKWLLVILPLNLFAQCWEDIPLVRNDTTLSQGLFVIEPKPGFRAVVRFEPIPAIVYEDFQASAGWTKATNTNDPFLNRDVYFSNVIGATLSVNVFGRKFEIVTATASHHGSCFVQLNNGPEVAVNLYSATRKDNVVVYESPMPEGTNSIKIKVGSGGYTVLDYIRVSQ